MRPARLSALLAVSFALSCPACAQTPAPIERRAPADPDLDLAANLIGQALFLRCFCADDNLTFTATGAAEFKAKAKTLDWTLSGINILKVERRSPTEIELDAQRVAVRYAPDRHEWDRHPQKTEPMRLLVADSATAAADPAVFRHALAAVFSVGIDRALQRSTPPYWQHFFDPQTPWPPDELTGVTVYTPGKPDASGQAATAPAATHKAEPSYTAAAQRDRVQGTVQLQFVVDAEGTPRRIAITQPLGYGLDAETAEAAARLRFTPATLRGGPVAASFGVRQEFTVAPSP